MPKKDYGGCILPRPVRSLEDERDTKRRTPAIFWGKLVSAPKPIVKKRHHQQVTDYMILLAMEKKKYQRCFIRGENPCAQFVPMWRVGELLFLCGEYQEYEYEAVEPIIREYRDKETGKKKVRKFYDRENGKKTMKTAYDFLVQVGFSLGMLHTLFSALDNSEADPMYTADVHEFIGFDADDDLTEEFVDPDDFTGYGGDNSDFGGNEQEEDWRRG